jgi:hypothetical protein
VAKDGNCGLATCGMGLLLAAFQADNLELAQQ